MEGYGNENPGAFQPTRPLRGATAESTTGSSATLFQPTRPLRGATKVLNRIEDSFTISTHAPLAGRDGRKCFLTLLINVFQPTRPLRGATQRPYRVKCRHIRFQPTRPLRGATALTACHSRALNNFNPRAPCGARLGVSSVCIRTTFISTHAPLAGRDPASPTAMWKPLNFNPRAPCGARHSEQLGQQ